MAKKRWETPKLLVLTRVRAEERILQACKDWGNPSGPNNMLGGCDISEYMKPECMPCYDSAAS